MIENFTGGTDESMLKLKARVIDTNGDGGKLFLATNAGVR